MKASKRIPTQKPPGRPSGPTKIRVTALLPLSKVIKLRSLSKMYGIHLSTILSEGIDLWEWRQRQCR
jgi:hypothetical protein